MMILCCTVFIICMIPFIVYSRNVPVLLMTAQAFHGATTAGVEQKFSVYKRVLCKERAHANLETHEGCLRLTLLTPSGKVAEASQKIWLARFSASRASSVKVRSTAKGVNKKGSESLWRNHLQAQVKHLASLRRKRSKTEIVASAASKGAACWDAEHDAQMGALEQQAKKAKVDACRSNQLLSHEMEASLEEDVIAADAKIRKNDQVHAAKARRISSNTVRQQHSLVNSDLYVGVRADLPECQDVLLAISRQNMQPVRVMDAPYLLLASMTIQPTVPWMYAVLLGRCACNAEFVTSGGSKGVALCFKGGTWSKRNVACSQSFQRACPQEAEAFDYIVHSPGSKWRLMQERDFLIHEANGRPKESAFQSMILVPENVKQDDAVYKRMANAFTLDASLKFWGKLDLSRSREGVCGR